MFIQRKMGDLQLFWDSKKGQKIETLRLGKVSTAFLLHLFKDFLDT